MFREVPMVEVREVLRLWLRGHGLRRHSGAAAEPGRPAKLAAPDGCGR